MGRSRRPARRARRTQRSSFVARSNAPLSHSSRGYPEPYGNAGSARAGRRVQRALVEPDARRRLDRAHAPHRNGGVGGGEALDRLGDGCRRRSLDVRAAPPPALRSGTSSRGTLACTTPGGSAAPAGTTTARRRRRGGSRRPARRGWPSPWRRRGWRQRRAGERLTSLDRAGVQAAGEAPTEPDRERREQLDDEHREQRRGELEEHRHAPAPMTITRVITLCQNGNRARRRAIKAKTAYEPIHTGMSTSAASPELAASSPQRVDGQRDRQRTHRRGHGHPTATCPGLEVRRPWP